MRIHCVHPVNPANPVNPVKKMEIRMQVNEEVLARTVKLLRERKILVPTFAQMRDPSTVPQKIKDRLKHVGLWDVDPVNLFRITWKNEPQERGGLFNHGNWIEFPSALTGTEARIVGLVGKWFPTGAHKVGAAFGCLVPKLVSGQFDPTTQKAVWPIDRQLLPRRGVRLRAAGLPGRRHSARGDEPRAVRVAQGDRRRGDRDARLRVERQGDLRQVLGDPPHAARLRDLQPVRGVRQRDLALPRDRQHDRRNLRADRRRQATGLRATSRPPARPARSRPAISCARSTRTSASSPSRRCNARRCCRCGFGGHRIEGIGDKHVPWIHNVRNTDMVVAIDDEQCLALMRLFNEPAGSEFLAGEGVAQSLIDQLPLVGISGICNLVAAIKTAKHFEMDKRDVIFTCLTDSMQLYGSRLEEERGRLRRPTTADRGRATFGRYLEGIGTDNLRELDLPRPQGNPQLQVLHLGRAAAALGRRPQPTLGSRFLDRTIRTSRRMGPADHGAQRRNRRREDALSSAFTLAAKDCA